MAANDRSFFDPDTSEYFRARGQELLKRLSEGDISEEDFGRGVDKLQADISASGEPVKRAVAKIRRKERIYAALIALIGIIIALILILIGGTKTGFAQALWVGIGGGVLASAVVAAAIPIIAGLWNKWSPISNEAIVGSLETIKADVRRQVVLGDYRWAQLVDFLNRDNNDD